MDDRKHPIPPREPRLRLGSDSAPIVVDVQRPAGPDEKLVVPTRRQGERLPADSPHESPFVVYCGDVRQVREGFAIALRAMGVDANIFHEGIALPANNPNTEDS